MIHPAKFLIFLLTGILLFSCEEKPARSVTAGTAIQKERQSDTTTPRKESKPKAKQPTQLIIKNKSDYSATFLEDLRHSPFEKIELIDNLLILEDHDTIEFSLEPAFGESVLYTGKKDKLAIALTVTRKNYTTINYKLEMVEFGKAHFNKTGEADVRSSFYLGSESDEDAETGEYYFVTEYSSHDADNCDIHIRISDEKGLCKVVKSCNGKIRDINLNNFPALVEKNRFYK